MRTRDERGTGHTRLYTGKIDGLVVVAEEGVTAFSSASHLTIGKDYTVSKFKPTPGGPLHVQQDPDKKGRQSDAWLTVISVTVTEP